jgi:hypothetical protein
VDLTSQALRQLGAQMQIIAGRKNLIWVTRGLPTQGRNSASSLGDVDFTNGLRSLNESLSRAQIAVYPVGGAINSNNYNALDAFGATDLLRLNKENWLLPFTVRTMPSTSVCIGVRH